MAPTVRQWLCVNRPIPGADKSHAGVSEAWVREVPMDFLPGRGDKIHLWRAEEVPLIWRDAEPPHGDPFDGPAWPVLERRFAPDGRPGLELARMYVDPEDGSIRDIRALRSDAGKPWWSDDHGDPATLLPGGGWTKLRRPGR